MAVSPDPPGMQAAVFIASVFALTLLPGTIQHAQASPEYIQSEQTAAGSVEDAPESSEHAFKLPTPVRVITGLADLLYKSSVNLHLRNYYFGRERDSRPTIEAWAQGAGIQLATPRWRDRLNLAATLYTSQKLYGPADKDGSKLLKPGQKSFTVLGQAYLEARLYGNIKLKAYRQRFELPYLNGNDARMVPNTFEAVSLYDFSGQRFVYGLGQTWRMKKRDASNFISMTEAAGIDGPDRALTTAGARYTFANKANVSVVNHYNRDFMNIFYAEGNSRTHSRLGIGFQFSAQYANQRSVGNQLGGDFDTSFRGAKLAASYHGLLLSLAHTSVSSNARIRNPWGGSPSYISLMIRDFDRAGEDAWLLGLSTDFSHFGDNGFSGFINYAWGDTPDNGADASPDESELDLTLDYKPEAGLMKGLWFRLRAAIVNQDGAGRKDLRDIRLIANYDFSVL